LFNIYRFNTAVFNKKRTSYRYQYHPILEANYTAGSQELNRAFVIGVDSTGSTVSGSSATAAEANLVGERLDVRHNPTVTTASAAASVATALIAKARLNVAKGRITIPPHCGIELWDVLNIVDAGCNQSINYRVSGYTLDYDVKQVLYQHRIELSAS